MADETPQAPTLTFHWHRPVLKARGLAFWLLAVLLVLTGFFYLFQVVYPQAQRSTPLPHHVVALNPADPAMREVLNKVQDLDFLILPPPAEASGVVSLEEQSPVFHPSFEGHQLQLQDLPHKTFTMPPARLLRMDAPVLPPLNFNELKTTPAPIKPVVTINRLAMRLSGPLTLRAMTVAPDLTGVTMVDPAACRIELGVNAEGIVDVLLPMASVETPETMKKLRSVIGNMRFAAANSKDSAPVWGTATFEWSTSAP